MATGNSVVSFIVDKSWPIDRRDLAVGCSRNGDDALDIHS
jgi:hypothetical protein